MRKGVVLVQWSEGVGVELVTVLDVRRRPMEEAVGLKEEIETALVTETGIVTATETATGPTAGTLAAVVETELAEEAEVGTRMEEAVVVDAANGTITTGVTVLTLSQVVIGRWRKEWDSDNGRMTFHTDAYSYRA